MVCLGLRNKLFEPPEKSLSHYYAYPFATCSKSCCYVVVAVWRNSNGILLLRYELNDVRVQSFMLTCT